jgi:hypothetical protein
VLLQITSVALPGDYNNDGYVDIYVANVGGPSALLQNNGDGTFTNVTTTAGVGNGKWAITPAFLDYDHDGDLDLFATNYVDWTIETDVACSTSAGQRDYCGPQHYRPVPSKLYRNNGDGTFTDVSEAAGITQAYGAGMGIIWDFNDDSFIDVLWPTTPTQPALDQSGDRTSATGHQWLP